MATPTTPTTVLVSAPPTPIKSRRAKRRPTVQERINATNLARTLTGYNDTSPIWNKRLPEVLVEIEQNLDTAITAIRSGSSMDYMVLLEEALLLNRELQKRTATYKVVGAQLR